MTGQVQKIPHKTQDIFVKSVLVNIAYSVSDTVTPAVIPAEIITQLVFPLIEYAAQIAEMR